MEIFGTGIVIIVFGFILIFAGIFCGPIEKLLDRK